MSDVVLATNQVRDRVVRTLASCVELSATMREFEDLFSTQVLYAAQQLHEVVAERSRLDAEYRRIQDKLDHGAYGDADELADDIHAALTDAATGPEVPSAEPGEEAGEGDDGLDPATKERIVREFKRVVLPNVHSDTSETPYAIFEVAYSAYRSRDYTMMEAFVIQYRGEVTACAPDGRPLTSHQLRIRLSEYQAAERRLDDRCASMRRGLTDDELRDPAGARARMARQQEEFRRAIVTEAERLRELRERLEALAERGAA